MAKASKSAAAKKTAARAKPAARAPSTPAACRAACRTAGNGDTRKAVQPPRVGQAGVRARGAAAEEALTRVTHETEVRGTETRVERVVERAPKPSLPDVDRQRRPRPLRLLHHPRRRSR